MHKSTLSELHNGHFGSNLEKKGNTSTAGPMNKLKRAGAVPLQRKEAPQDYTVNVAKLFQGKETTTTFFSKYVTLEQKPSRAAFMKQAWEACTKDSQYGANQECMASVLIQLCSEGELRKARSAPHAWEMFCQAVEKRETGLRKEEIRGLWLVEDALEAVDSKAHLPRPQQQEYSSTTMAKLRSVINAVDSTALPPSFTTLYEQMKHTKNEKPRDELVSAEDAERFLAHQGINVRAVAILLKYDDKQISAFLGENATVIPSSSCKDAFMTSFSQQKPGRGKRRREPIATKNEQAEVEMKARTFNILELNILMTTVFAEEANYEAAVKAGENLCGGWPMLAAEQRASLLTRCREQLQCFKETDFALAFVGLLEDLETAAARLEAETFPGASKEMVKELERDEIYRDYTGAALGFSKPTFSCLSRFVNIYGQAHLETTAPRQYLRLARILQEPMHLMLNMSPRLEQKLAEPEAIGSIEKHADRITKAVIERWGELPLVCRYGVLHVEELHYQAAMLAVQRLESEARNLKTQGNTEQEKTKTEETSRLKRRTTEAAEPYRRQLLIEGMLAALTQIPLRTAQGLNLEDADALTARLTDNQKSPREIRRHDLHIILKMLLKRIEVLKKRQELLKKLQGVEAARQPEAVSPTHSGKLELLAAETLAETARNQLLRTYLEWQRDKAQQENQGNRESKALERDTANKLLRLWLKCQYYLRDEFKTLWNLDGEPSRQEKGVASQQMQQVQAAETETKKGKPKDAATFLLALQRQVELHRDTQPSYPAASTSRMDILCEHETMAIFSPKNFPYMFIDSVSARGAYGELLKKVENLLPTSLQECLRRVKTPNFMEDEDGEAGGEEDEKGGCSNATEERANKRLKTAKISKEALVRNAELLQVMCRVFLRLKSDAPFDTSRALKKREVELDKILFVVGGGKYNILGYDMLSLDTGMKDSDKFATFALKHQRHLRVLGVPYHLSGVSTVAILDDLIQQGAVPENVVVLNMTAFTMNCKEGRLLCSKGEIHRSELRSPDELFQQKKSRQAENRVCTIDAAGIWNKLAQLEGTTPQEVASTFPPEHSDYLICSSAVAFSLGHGSDAERLLRNGAPAVLFSDYSACTVRSRRLVTLPPTAATQEVCEDFRRRGIRLYGYSPGMSQLPYGIEVFDLWKDALNEHGELWDAELYWRDTEEKKRKVREAVLRALQEAKAAPMLEEKEGSACLILSYDVLPGEKTLTRQPCHMLRAVPGGLAKTPRKLAELSCSELREDGCRVCRAPATCGCPLVLRSLTHCDQHVGAALEMVSLSECHPTGLKQAWANLRCCYDGCGLAAEKTFAAAEYRQWMWCLKHSAEVSDSMRSDRRCQGGWRFDGIHCECSRCQSLAEEQDRLHGEKHLRWTPGRPVLLLEPPPYYQHLTGSPPPLRRDVDLILSGQAVEVRQAIEHDLVDLLKQWKSLATIKIVVAEDDFLAEAVRPHFCNKVQIFTFQDIGKSHLKEVLDAKVPTASHVLYHGLIALTSKASTPAAESYPRRSEQACHYQKLLPKNWEDVAVAHPAERLRLDDDGLVLRLLKKWQAYDPTLRLPLARLRQVLHHLGMSSPICLVRTQISEHIEAVSIWHLLALCAYDVGVRRPLLEGLVACSVRETIEDCAHVFESLCLTGQVDMTPVPILAESLGKLAAPPVRSLCRLFLERLEAVLSNACIKDRTIVQGVSHAFNLHLPLRTPCEAFLKSLQTRLTEQVQVAAELGKPKVAAVVHVAIQSARFHILDNNQFKLLIKQLRIYRSVVQDKIFEEHCRKALHNGTAAAVARALEPPCCEDAARTEK